MSKAREEKVKDTVKEYLSTGKMPPALENKTKLSPLQLVLQGLFTLVLMIVSTIKFHLSKVVPVLAEPKYLVRDKVVLLTGAGGGFGRRLAERLAQRGAIVACVDVDSTANQRSVDAATRAAASATGRPSSQPVAFAFQANLANREETYKVVKDVEEKLGRVDILISGAVCFTTYDIAGFDDDEIDFLIDLNLKSTIWLVRAVLPGMKARNSGHIAVFSSIAACLPCPGVSLYATCKAGLKGLMNSLYYEFQGQKLDIGVTTVYPYFSPTNSFIRSFTHTRLPDVDPYEIVEEVINGIETRELNIMVPRWMSGALGLYGIFPKEALNHIISLADFRLNAPGIMPKATITVDKWTEAYGAFRGPDGQFITAHDGDEVTPEMLEKADAIMKTLKEKQEQGEDVCEAVDEYTASVALEYSKPSNAKRVNGTSTINA